MQHAQRRAIAEAYALEAERAARDAGRHGAGAVRHLARHRDRAHAVLDGADILEDRGHALRHPARHVGDLPGERHRGGDAADIDAALRPEPERHRRRADQKRRIQHRQYDAERGHQPQLAAEEMGVVVDRGAHERILVARPGEELHRQDVGVAVDDPAGEGGARLGEAPRARAQLRHEVAQRQRIAREPQQDRHCEADIARAQKHDRRAAVNQDVPDGVGADDDAFTQGGAGLHDAIGDAAGEVVLEKAPALTHHVPVILPAHEIGEARIDRLVGDELLEGDRHWPRDQQHGCHAGKLRPSLAEQSVGRMARGERHESPDEDRDGGVEEGHHGTGDEERANEMTNLPRVMPIERRQPRRRLRVRRQRRGLEQFLEEGEDGHRGVMDDSAGLSHRH